ncbi:cyclopropane-fatty-acyl-phospholipid synthase [Vibrio variabilis]|uniref:Cyclopropane-fatty-acyl-phospholipid synthase n=1 Tax=Vibrio variabilis TaxID=990271 RepID=A0ABQ0JIG1_9VIBR|nr:cyclopropane-fatty-acyl-phospholipid synthase [Vibrio variabilis]
MEQANLFNDLLYGSGIEINGSNPWDIQINSTETFERILLDGSLGFGEAYMDGLWDCDDLAELINRLLRANIADKFDAMMAVRLGAAVGKQKFMNLFNPQNITQSKDSVRHHYDIGNDLYTSMLDKRLTYTCGYWRYTDCLEQAQEDNLISSAVS